MAPRGGKANRDVVRYGIVHLRSCFGACGAVMAVMFLAGHDLHLMAPLMFVTNVERFQNPRRTHVSAGILIGMALLTITVA